MRVGQCCATSLTTNAITLELLLPRWMRPPHANTHSNSSNGEPCPTRAIRGKLCESQRFYESRYVDVDQDEVRHRSGKVHSYTSTQFGISGLAVLPIFDDGSTYLIGQYRYVSQRYTWELPRGSGPKTTEPLETAKRELQEETGARAGEWLEVVRLMVSPGISDELAPCFVAWNLRQGSACPDPQEDLSIRRVSFQHAVAECLNGVICDAASVATILAVQTGTSRAVCLRTFCGVCVRERCHPGGDECGTPTNPLLTSHRGTDGRG